MLTAKGQVAEQERGKEVGANEYIVKPFSPMEILTKVKTILDYITAGDLFQRRAAEVL